MKVRAAIEIAIRRSRTGAELPEPVVQKRMVVGEPCRRAELSPVDHIARFLRSGGVDDTEGGVFRSGRREAHGDVAAIEGRRIVADHEVRATGRGIGRGINQKLFAAVEPVALVELWNVLACQALLVEIMIAGQAANVANSGCSTLVQHLDAG